MSAGGRLEEWAGRFGRRRPGGSPGESLRFAFYGRVSTEDWQDPGSSRMRQREQAGALVRGHGMIVAEFFDVGESRSVAWARRPQAAALVAQLADPGRGWALSRSRISVSSSTAVGSAGPASSPRLRRSLIALTGSTMTK